MPGSAGGACAGSGSSAPGRRAPSPAVRRGDRRHPRDGRLAGSGRRPVVCRRRSPAQRCRRVLAFRGPFEALTEHHFEGLRGAFAVRHPGLAQAERVDDDQRRRRRFFAEDLGEGGEGDHQLLPEVLLRAVGERDPVRGRGDDRLEGREEALLLRLEMLVEGRLRDPGKPDQLTDGRRGVAVARDGLDHRAFEPATLVAFSLTSPDSPRPSAQGAEEGARALRPWHVRSLTQIARAA